jgi:hypothetical protein
MERLKTFDQHKQLKGIENTKVEDVKVKKIESEAAKGFDAKSMDGLVAPGNKVELPKSEIKHEEE